MSAGFIDFVFEGSSFSPKMLKALTGFSIVSLAEAGEPGKRGRYKGKPMPYGLGYLEVKPKSSEAMSKALERVIDELSNKKDLLKQSGVDDITLDLENIPGADAMVNLNKSLIKKIYFLGASVEVSTLEEGSANTEILINSDGLTVNDKQVKRASSRLSAFSNPFRIRLVNSIEKAGEIEIHKLSGTLKERRSVVARHLVILRGFNIVSMRKEGRRFFYSVNRARVFEIKQGARILDYTTHTK